MKLSLRNAKRQFNEYTLFFVTLTCAVASMYAFNALIFSDTVKALPDMELLPYLIVAASLLIILIMGWIISYMINYMLKKRSREFSVYMVSGIPNRKISRLIFYENSLIGLLAFVPGVLLGMLFSQILEAVLLNMFGLPYTLHFSFSPSTVGLTLLYFAVMLLYSIRKNGKWIRRVQLRDMLYYDRQNEKAPFSGGISAILIFWLAALGFCSYISSPSEKVTIFSLELPFCFCSCSAFLSASRPFLLPGSETVLIGSIEIKGWCRFEDLLQKSVLRVPLWVCCQSCLCWQSPLGGLAQLSD